MKKLFLVDTVSSHRISHVISCMNEESAADTIVCDNPTEFSQEHLGVQISRIREITEEEYMELFDKDNAYLKSWPEELKKSLIHTVILDSDSKESGLDLISTPGNL